MRKYFTLIAVFVFMFCFVGCNANASAYFFNFHFDNMQVSVGDEINIFALEYSTNVYNYEALRVSSTDESVVSASSNGDIEALGAGSCKIVVNIVSSGKIVSGSFDVLVVDDSDALSLNDDVVINDANDDNEESTDSENCGALTFECARQSGNVFVLTIFKDGEAYFDFGYHILSSMDDILSKTKYGTCLEIVAKNNENISIEIFDLNSNATTIFNSQEP